MVLYYAMRQVLPFYYRRLDYKHTDVYKSWKMLSDFRKSQKGDGKSLMTMYKESNKLAKFWHCFPDTYFRFGMFLEHFGDIELMKTFIPQQAYARYASDKDLKYHILIDDKILFHNIMRMYGLPVPERYFVFQDKTFRKDGQVISDEEVDAIVTRITDDRIFIKRYRGGAASGISVAERKQDGFYTEDGQKLSATMIRNNYCDSNYIFEKQLVQDPILSKLNPDTINTCRVLTYKDKVVSCSIRVGRKGSFVDNAAKGGIVLSLDMETGRIEEYGLREYDLTKYYEHPDTKIKFKDYEVPMWPAVKELVEKTIQLIPYYNSVGFDVATTVNGPVIIEINSGTGVYASQMGKKQGIADKFIH